ncbi:TRAP transporter small permease subunit [Pseudooceanicola sp.]|uniref:TRAP transporter small permease subunit n=1 Tax=Pseudooceanicola sp. TaxID=1914328 RepID=UPI00262D21D9|nr:TRAP transporter small permease subunit [Pseudooceanicola sp.]MDF1857092.1 TRAP transporter small permease subunit [Pseudooceanicola sp.]
MHAMAAIIRVIGALNAVIGRVMSWLALGIVIVCFTVVVQRYLFGVSYLWLRDLYIWLNGAMFTGVAGFALARGGHVRVDIFYRPASVRRKAVIDLFGVLVFLLPFMVVVVVYSWPFVTRSWSYWEGSSNVGGMPGLFVLKSFIIVFSVLVALQGIAMALHAVLVLADREHLLPEDLRYPPNVAPAVHTPGETGHEGTL